MKFFHTQLPIACNDTICDCRREVCSHSEQDIQVTHESAQNEDSRPRRFSLRDCWVVLVLIHLKLPIWNMYSQTRLSESRF